MELPFPLQALLEFNVDVPQQASGKSPAVVLKFFEAYWDSGWRRCGDTRQCGWQQWMHAKLTGTPQDDSNTGPAPLTPTPVDESNAAIWGVIDPSVIPATAVDPGSLSPPSAVNGSGVGSAKGSGAVTDGGAWIHDAALSPTAGTAGMDRHGWHGYLRGYLLAYLRIFVFTYLRISSVRVCGRERLSLMWPYGTIRQARLCL